MYLRYFYFSIYNSCTVLTEFMMICSNLLLYLSNCGSFYMIIFYFVWSKPCGMIFWYLAWILCFHLCFSESIIRFVPAVCDQFQVWVRFPCSSARLVLISRWAGPAPNRCPRVPERSILTCSTALSTWRDSSSRLTWARYTAHFTLGQR